MPKLTFFRTGPHPSTMPQEPTAAEIYGRDFPNGAVVFEEGDPAIDAITAGELAVLALLSSPLSQREIGDELFISINTVKTHCRNIYTKLRAGSRGRFARSTAPRALAARNSQSS